MAPSGKEARFENAIASTNRITSYEDQFKKIVDDFSPTLNILGLSTSTVRSTFTVPCDWLKNAHYPSLFPCSLSCSEKLVPENSDSLRFIKSQHTHTHTYIHTGIHCLYSRCGFCIFIYQYHRHKELSLETWRGSEGKRDRDWTRTRFRVSKWLGWNWGKPIPRHPRNAYFYLTLFHSAFCFSVQFFMPERGFVVTYTHVCSIGQFGPTCQREKENLETSSKGLGSPSVMISRPGP